MIFQKSLIQRKAGLEKTFKIVSYLTPEEVKLLTEEAKKKRNGERNSLLILVL